MNFTGLRVLGDVSVEQVAVDHEGDGYDNESSGDDDYGDGDGRGVLPTTAPFLAWLPSGG